jgi:MSHA biogenesis protein MshP
MTAPRLQIRRAAGFAYIAAIVFLVVLAGFALAALRLSDTAQTTASQQVLGAQVGQAARTGLEWAFYRLKTPGATCAAVLPAPPPDFVAATGYRVTLTCDMKTYAEGQSLTGGAQTKFVFQLTATACNGAAATCPDEASVTILCPPRPRAAPRPPSPRSTPC